MRIISIGDGIDFPNDDDWVKIQFQFLMNEMPVTDTSRKVRSVVKRRQEDGRWICAAPYGYIVNKQQEFEVVPTEAEIVRKIFALYIGGYNTIVGGADAIVMTGGIGENSTEVRERILKRLGALGIKVDKKANAKRGETIVISTKDSKIPVVVIPTNEELMIARDTVRVLEGK